MHDAIDSQLSGSLARLRHRIIVFVVLLVILGSAIMAPPLGEIEVLDKFFENRQEQYRLLLTCLSGAFIGIVTLLGGSYFRKKDETERLRLSIAAALRERYANHRLVEQTIAVVEASKALTKSTMKLRETTKAEMSQLLDQYRSESSGSATESILLNYPEERRLSIGGAKLNSNTLAMFEDLSQALRHEQSLGSQVANVLSKLHIISKKPLLSPLQRKLLGHHLRSLHSISQRLQP